MDCMFFVKFECKNMGEFGCPELVEMMCIIICVVEVRLRLCIGAARWSHFYVKPNEGCYGLSWIFYAEKQSCVEIDYDYEKLMHLLCKYVLILTYRYI